MEAATFEFSDNEFSKFREIINTHTGIHIGENKRDLVYGRLSRRVRDLGLNSFSDYREELEKGSAAELEKFSNLITTNLTSFFREEHHFEYLRTTLFPELIKQRRKDRKIRIWSAGCSSGEEAYSIAMVAQEVIPNIQSWDFKILASDLDTTMVTHAQLGVYDLDRLSGVSKLRLHRWFQKGAGDNQGKVRVSPEIRSLITFNPLNLMEVWPMQGAFDVIFCRNVVIYFDSPTQTKLFERFSKQLNDDGTLFIGHSETLNNITDKFRLLSKTIYKKS
jgi:chemotaxis protein methyltransferase CheR